MAIRGKMVAAPALSQTCLSKVHPDRRDSARNLLHYLELRRHDLRPLQMQLAALGLSSLGRAESHVLASVDAVVEVLHQLMHRPWKPSREEALTVDFLRGRQLLEAHTEALLGPTPDKRSTRIMVTMPSEAADDYLLVHQLMEQGMDCMRLNCAHDNAAGWGRMIDHLRRAEQVLGRSCRVVMDLAGPKLRTGPLEAGPAVVKIRPQRDVCGRVTAPTRVWLTSVACPRESPSVANACLALPQDWLGDLGVGDLVTFTDARDSRREFVIVDVTEEGVWAEGVKTSYVISGTVLHHEPRASNATGKMRKVTVGDLPRREKAILLKKGDLLVLSRNLKPGRPISKDSEGHILTPATIGCTISDVFDDAQAGESIWLDDGKIGGKIEKVESERVLVRITHARTKGEKLRGDKGINLPESRLRLSALSAKDLEDLAFVAEHADVVELSFANTVGDVEQLQQHLARSGARQPAIVLKIETRCGFESLPSLLLTAMRRPICGVMIARGDLAVECGFERMAEVQEEILWMCEAAHVPVIWATQVLETLAKDGRPSRAEITDAAMGERAECVMLNKGPHIRQALSALDKILKRIQTHQSKKRSMLRHLSLADHLPGTNEKDSPQA